ncbi:MAG TPA: hypothetical protein VNW06_05380 [Cytophagaceae bacterium]|jgi:hypothetical protein|nr:hypothetical protein [Cytophagaceae bacterium]
MKTFLVVLLFLLVSETNGQINNKAYFGLSGFMDIPSSSFSRRGYTNGIGFACDYYSKDLIFDKSKKWGLRVGGSCFLARQNSITNNVHLHDPYEAPGKQQLTNNHSGFDFQTILISEHGTVRPYAGIFIGCGLFTSNQNLTIDQPVSGYQAYTNTSYNTASIDYGFTSGVMFKIAKLTYINFKGSVSRYTNNIQFDNLNHLGNDDFMKLPDYVSVKPLIYSFQLGLIFKLQAKPGGPYHRGTSSHSHYGGGFHGGGGGCGGMMLR